MPKKHFLTIFFALVFSLLFLSVLYLMLGNKNVPLTELSTNKMVLQLRLPRLISLFLTGFLLSVSGFLVQIMTRNPIAEMSTLGISGGSSLALSLLLTLGWSTNDGISVMVSSLGAFIALAVVMLLTARTHFQPLKVVLVGTSVGLFATSLASSMTFASHDTQAYFRWIVGSFSGITNTKVSKLVGENEDGDEDSLYMISGVPCIGRHYLNSNDNANFVIEAIKERKDYIDYCLTLLDNSMTIDFKFFNTYGESKFYKLEDKVTSIGNNDITMRFKLSLRDSSDITTKDDITQSIKEYIENINEIGDLHIPNLITDIINEYNDRIHFIEFVGFNTFGADDQHIIKVDDENPFTVPEFINVRNIIDKESGELIPAIDIVLV